MSTNPQTRSRSDPYDWVDDDDDMDYDPSMEMSETNEELYDIDENEFDEEDEEEEDDEEDDDDYEDAAEELGGIDIQFTIEPDTGNVGNEDETGTGDAATEARPIRVTTQQIVRLLGANGLRRMLQSHGLIGNGIIRGLDDDEDHAGYGGTLRRRRRRPKDENRFPKVPSDEGKVLMKSGIYGAADTWADRRRHRKANISQRLMWRRLGVEARGTQKRANQLIAQSMVPTSTTADKIIHYDSRCYSGQFSDDGNFFFSCAQDFRVRMYDTSNPYEWKYYKTVDYPFGQWTITDATLSPDNKYLAYSSIRHMVCLAPTDPSDRSEPHLLDFTNASRANERRSQFGFMGRHGFGIWSLRFSGDGREIVAGTSDRSVVVYDVERAETVMTVQNHEDDVNAVCFGDESSPHILYSGSDDTTLRVWDRRSLGDHREAGVFMGHTEGLTYVDSKGDGRYVLSNGKDQTMKLWDLRKMMTTADFDKIDPAQFTRRFDYRFQHYSEDDYEPHPHDCSVVTFRGHSVLKTLIRCHFSPPGSTNNRYVYSGSEDGKVYIYNLDATLAGKIDVSKATRHSRPRHPDLFYDTGYGDSRGRSTWKTCVRDASWHPNVPIIAATSWNGWGMATGTCTVHSWSDGMDSDEADYAPMGTSYNDKLQIKEECRNPASRGGVRTREREEGGGLRSHVVPPRRHGYDDDDEELEEDEPDILW